MTFKESLYIFLEQNGSEHNLQIYFLSLHIYISIGHQDKKGDSPQPAHVEQEFDRHEDWVVEVNLINIKSKGQSDKKSRSQSDQ